MVNKTSNPRPLQRGHHHLSSSHTTTCTLADTYYKVAGTWVDGSSNNGFTADGSGRITFIGIEGTYVNLTGVSDLSVSAAPSKVTYALYKNGVLVTGAETPSDFTASSKVGNISISSVFPVVYGDYFEIYVKCDVPATDVVHNTLMLSFWGDR